VTLFGVLIFVSVQLDPEIIACISSVWVYVVSLSRPFTLMTDFRSTNLIRNLKEPAVHHQLNS